MAEPPGWAPNIKPWQVGGSVQRDEFRQGVGMVSVGAQGDGIKHWSKWCPTPHASCLCAPGLQEQGSAGSSPPLLPPAPWCRGPTVLQPHRQWVCVFPFCPHRWHRQPRLQPFPLPAPHPTLGAVDCSMWDLAEPVSPMPPPKPAQQSLGMSQLWELSCALAAPLPSLSSGFNNHLLAQYGKWLQQPQGRLSPQGHQGATAEGLPPSCRVREGAAAGSCRAGGGLAILSTPTTPGISPGI